MFFVFCITHNEREHLQSIVFSQINSHLTYLHNFNLSISSEFNSILLIKMVFNDIVYLVVYAISVLHIGFVGIMIGFVIGSKVSHNECRRNYGKYCCRYNFRYKHSWCNNFNTKVLLTESLLGFTVCFLGGLVGLVLGSIRMPLMMSILKLKPKSCHYCNDTILC